MKLYLIRHAQRGRGKEYDTINWLGKKQAKRICSYFKNKKITHVYCSENTRAVQTFDYIRPFLKKGVLIEITKEVRQHNTPEEVGKDAIKEFDLKVESEPQLIKRVTKFINKIKKNNIKDTVLVVSHKEVIKAMVCKIMGRPFKEKIYINRLPSGSISYFEFNSKGKLKDALIGDLTSLMVK